jgi:hypothetical protein
LPEFLQDDNPVLVDAALDLYVKFRRESTGLAPFVEPLLDHPRPDFRRRAALVLGRLLARAGPPTFPSASSSSRVSPDGRGATTSLMCGASPRPRSLDCRMPESMRRFA